MARIVLRAYVLRSMMDGGGNTGGHLYMERANLTWTEREEKWFLLPIDRVEPFVRAAVIKVFRGAAAEESPLRWRMEVTRATSVFNRRFVTIALEPGDDEGASVVTAKVTFEPSPARVGALLWMSTSVVGIPAAFAWRAGSVAQARSFARETFSALWKELSEDRVARAAYR